ncbi:MAG: amidohydrolase [Actinobacteria bacterium 13_1_20CM_3_71_11]|nr:MAG: amidohydrolase [Actinobacteria bacterium 13_1_20CM_3_71_11]
MPFTDLAELYQDLHAHPELSFAEHRTAGIAAERARALGYEVTEGIGGTGVVAVLRNGPGPTVLLRADLDGLPVLEETGLPYASVQRGRDPDGIDVPVMHACGHDMHVTWLIGALDQLWQRRGAWSGTVLAVFQPAEELGDGARAMVEDGLFDRFDRPDVVLGQHVSPFPAGIVKYRPGPTMAGMDTVTVRLFGQGGHGSRPETTVDPVVMAAAVVLRLQTLVSREVSPLDTGVVTVGSLHAGTKANIIPAEADLRLSVRSFAEPVRQRLLAGIRRIVRAEAAASGATREPDIVGTASVPVLVNDPDTTGRVVGAIERELGTDRVATTPAITGSEDFSVFGSAAGVPSCFWFVGGADPERYAAAEAAGRLDQDVPSNHSPRYAPVLEPTVTAGVRTLVAAALAWLSPTQISVPR